MDKEIYHKTLEAEKDQTEFKSEIVRGNWKNKSEKQISAIENIKNLHKSGEKLLNCLMIILKLHLRLNTNKFMGKDSEY